jgi:membrane-bound metal-dependent hydrolase YbcI (DUF457 family)
MNIATHGLASLALLRAAWPRAPKQMWIAAVVAGTIADVDLLSAWTEPARYLAWRGTYTHALLGSILLASLFAVVFPWLAGADLRNRFSRLAFFFFALAAQCLHLALDLCGSTGIALLWPFTRRRFAADWVADLDPWIIFVLLAALLLPELLHLVSSEIGTRDTRPRGRVGALLGFSILLFYVTVRADFHGEVLALMQSRTFRSEVAKHVGAFPEALSPFTWQGLVETERGLHRITVTEGLGGPFDPESAETLYKPEPSVALDTAQKTATAQAFLETARFPKATVETTPAGARVEIRDLAYLASGNTAHEVVAVMQLDSANRVTSQEFAWANQRAEE